MMGKKSAQSSAGDGEDTEQELPRVAVKLIGPWLQ
jgi:hypothetical protein